MIKVKIEVKDFSKELIKDLQVKQLSLVTQGGEIIRGEMAARAPIDSGDLINSIMTQAFVEDGKATSETGPTAKHGPFIEYGTGIHAKPEGGGSKAKKIPWFYKDEAGDWHKTSGMEAQPFAEPGFQAAKPRIDNLADKVLRA